jgi:hypothetical protein
VRDRPRALIAAAPWVFWSVLRISRDSASFFDGVAVVGVL